MPKTAIRSSTRSTPHAKIRKRLSRMQLNERLRELYDQISDHICMTESLKRVIEPNGEHIVAEWRVRKAFDVMLESQLRSLHDIKQHTANLCEREAAHG